MSEIVASIRLTLPADGREAAGVLAAATAEWAKLVHALDGVQASFTVGAESVVVRRRRRKRNKPQLASDTMGTIDIFERQLADVAG